MKMTKKVLSLFLAMLMLLSIATITSSATALHTIERNSQTTINASEYSSASSVYVLNDQEKKSSGDITVSGTRLNFIKEKTVQETVVPVISTVKYTLNVESASYYKISVCGHYKNSAPVITASIDDGTSKTARTLYDKGDRNRKIGNFYIEAGQHTLTLKIKDGNADIKNILIKDIEHYVGSGLTTIAANDYYSASVDTEVVQQDYGIIFPTGYESPGISGPLVISSDESGNLGSGSGGYATYNLNVATAGQYRAKIYSSVDKRNVISAEVNVYLNDEIIAYGVGRPDRWGSNVTYVDPEGVVETSAFNLDAGPQQIKIKILPFNDDFTADSANIFYYYFEIERVNDKQETVYIYDNVKNIIEAEDVFYTDEEVDLGEESATITANTTAIFYANVATAGNYAFSIKYKAADNTSVFVNALTKNIYKNTLLPTNDEFLTYTLGVSNLDAGENRITITPDKNLEIEKIYIKKISDESALSAINAASTEDALKVAITEAETALDVELTDATNGIFYDKPVYNRLIKRDYSSIKDFIAEYNKALISEYDNPWVTLYIGDAKKLELETGNIKFTATTGYVPKGSTMIVALYENLADGFKTLHNFAICEEVSENTYDFLFGQTEINPEKSYTLEFYYWDGLENVSPIEVFNAVYEEIYVSADADGETADGTEENPYPTIQEALEKVKQINDYQWGDIIVNVKGGTYTLAETMVIDENYSGKNGYNVIIRGEEGNQPIISGGRKVEEWTEGENGIWSAPLSDVEYVRNLYIDGYPAVMARSDRLYNTAISKRDASTISTTIYRLSSTPVEPETADIAMSEESTGIDASLVGSEDDYGFVMSKKELGIDFANPIGMEFVWPYTFENHITPIIGYRKTDSDISFYMNHNLLQKRESTVFKTGVSFYLQNAKELVNKPGEFCYDKVDGRIYYYPYSYENMENAKVYIGNIEGMVKVEGSSLDSKVENITFENLSFRYGAYNFISKYGYIGSQTDGILQPFEWSEGNIGYKAQFEVNNADNVNITGCEFACLGSAAISMIDSVSNSDITGNIIRDTSGTGIRVGHPAHNRQREGIEVCQYIDITNNVIRRIAGETFNNCGITVYYEKFINILHNDIENVPYSGMSIGWGWGGGSPYDCSDIDISYNKIQDVMNTLHDGGGIYTLGPLKNSKISNNYLNGHGSRSGGMLYNDQGSSLLEVYNNVILNAVLSQAITMADRVSTTNKLTYYNNYSDVGTHSKIADFKEIDFEDHIIVTGEGDSLSNSAARAIYQNAGLEFDYQYLLSETGVELPAGREISSTLPDEPVSDAKKLYSTEYVEAESSDDLELIPYADGMGVSITGNKKVTYKLNIPESGYYRIMLLAKGGEAVGYNGIKVSGDAQNVIMRVYGSAANGNTVNQNQLSIWNSSFYNYRICTAYFEAGTRNITFEVSKSTHEVIIKELQYANVEKTISGTGVNIVRIKDYYNVSGLNSNAFENAQSGYPATGAKYHVTGAVTNGGGKTTTLTYKMNVEEAGTYRATAAAWVGKNSPVTYKIIKDGQVLATGTTKSYTSMKKSEDTDLGEFQLPKGKYDLTFEASSVGSNYSIMYYFTLEKTN